MLILAEGFFYQHYYEKNEFNFFCNNGKIVIYFVKSSVVNKGVNGAAVLCDGLTGPTTLNKHKHVFPVN